MKQWAWNILVSLDQLLNVLLGPVLNLISRTKFFGYPDETLSSAFGKCAPHSRFCRVVARLLDFVFGEGHVRESIERDEGRGTEDTSER